MILRELSFKRLATVVSILASIATVVGAARNLFAPSVPQAVTGPVQTTVLGNNYITNSSGQRGGVTIGAVVGRSATVDAGTSDSTDHQVRVAQLGQQPGAIVLGKQITVEAGPGPLDRLWESR
jgi:hypothetical protein